MNLVGGKLWIGSLSSALDDKLLHDQGIVAVVTVDVKPLPSNGNLDYLFIQAHDVCEQDLFGCFESVYEFIEKGVTGGGVLVHCFHGVSRSAALVISYLQKKYSISVDEALARLQAVRPSVMPNEGFMAQLRLYGLLLELNKMHSTVVMWYNLQNMAKTLPHSTFAGATPQAGSSAVKCRSCRHVLADDGDILYHKPGEDPDWKDLSWVRFALSDDSRTESCRQAFFVVPPTWMTANNAPQGKLNCPKCRSKIGAFSWKQSLKCPCTASFQPAFYFTPSRVDFVVKK